MAAFTNRLARETSPYLLQHARNPVDWYPWGDEALARAKAEDKPILLSIGYAACHWCHVMERESFEDPEVARVMNERFVCVKVDREERPDLDSVYMTAVQAMTGRGGWPMTVFLTPDGAPFYGGTYFPPEDHHGLPSFRRLLDTIHEAWTTKRDEIEGHGKGLLDHIARASSLRESDEPLTTDLLDGAVHSILEQLDPEWGGFGGAPKFPQPMTLEFLVRMRMRGLTGERSPHRTRPDLEIPASSTERPPYAYEREPTINAVEITLDHMVWGGIFDQVGGGFHRYSVDRFWMVPHFEKMLYDNAQLMRLYTRMWQLTGPPRYHRAALATADYLLREMRHPEGGFFSSQDADSEGVEGKFYVWSYDELIALAGDDMPAAVAAYALSGDGNWEGANVLWHPQPTWHVADRIGIAREEMDAALDRVRARLFEARERRVRPAVDDKVIAAWNGLAIAGLAETGRVFDRPDLIEAAARAAEFVLTALRTPDGRLRRSWRDGRTSGPAFLDDYAMMADACLTLYETTFEPRWWTEAWDLGQAILRLFPDHDRGGFYDTASDVPSPVIRPKDLFDNALPCGNSAAADVLLRLAALSGETAPERSAVSFLRLVGPAMAVSPLGFGNALNVLDRHLSPATEIAIVGDPSAFDTRRLTEFVAHMYLPNRVLAVGPEGSPEPPLLRGRSRRGGVATAYVCERFACREPVTDEEDLAEQLDAVAWPASDSIP